MGQRKGGREGADTACQQNNAHPSPTLPPFLPPFSPQSPRVPPLSSDQVTQTLHISRKKSETLSPKMSGKSRGRRICGWGRKQETPEREMGKKSALPLVSWPQKTRTDAAFRSLSSRPQNRDLRIERRSFEGKIGQQYHRDFVLYCQRHKLISQMKH